MKEYQKVIEDTTSAIRLRHNHGNSYALRSMACALTGQLPSARLDYHHAHVLNADKAPRAKVELDNAEVAEARKGTPVRGALSLSASVPSSCLLCAAGSD
jgi:hypothetical protein